MSSGMKINYKKNGDQEYTARNYVSALQWYNWGLAKYPTNSALLIAKGNTLYKLGRYDEAFQIFYKVIEQKKKFKIFDNFIQKNTYVYSPDYAGFCDVLHTKHNLKIVCELLPGFIPYFKSQQEAKMRKKEEFARFKQQFTKSSCKNLIGCIDKFFELYSMYDDLSFELFFKFCQSKGFVKDAEQLRDVMVKRQDFLALIERNRTNVAFIDSLTGIEFEHFMAEHFKKHHFLVNISPPTRDKGSDLVITNENTRMVVQTKRTNSSTGIRAVQATFSAMHFHRCDRCVLISTNFFTVDAIKMAKQINVELWDRTRTLHELFSTYDSL
jgi:tetratricopeptide (TPR) repeat protein